MRRLSSEAIGQRLSAPLMTSLRYGTSRDKVVTADDAVYLIRDGATITVGGFVSQGCPDYTVSSRLVRVHRACRGSPSSPRSSEDAAQTH